MPFSSSGYEPRKTLIDLYNERDEVEWYWRFLGVLSASLILLGFLVFPSAFQISTNLAASQGTISIVAVIFLALGYSLSVALWFIRTSWLFQFDVLFMYTPCLSSCVIGVLNVGIALGIHPATSGQWTTASISALALSLASAVIYAVLAYLTNRKINEVRSRDPTRRRMRTDSESAVLINNPEEEAQRAQLLKLLKQKESGKTSPEASQSTFRIDIPEDAKVSKAVRSTTTYLTAPTNTYENRRRSTSMDGSPIHEQFTVPPQVEPIDSQLQTLERARARSQQTRSRDVSGGPPIIINTRHVDDIGEIPLSERHPLERAGDFIRGKTGKDGVYPAKGVYRPEDADYSFDPDPNIAGRRADIELEDSHRGRRPYGRHAGELEAEVIPRIVRVQTDGWPQSS